MKAAKIEGTRRGFMTALVVWVIFGLLSTVAAQSGPTTLTGTLGLKFIDPLPGNGIESAVIPVLLRPEGIVTLELEAGAADFFAGREVVVQGRTQASLTERGLPVDVFVVETLELLDPAANVDPLAPVSGNFPTVNLLCLQAGDNAPFAASRYPAIFDTPGNGLVDYWGEVSYGNLTLNGSATLAQWLPISDYPEGFQESDQVFDYFQECIDRADSQVNFSQFSSINFFDADENSNFSFAFFGTVPFNTADTGEKGFRITYNGAPLSFHNAGTVGHEMGHTFFMRHVGLPGVRNGAYITRRSIMSGGDESCWRDQAGTPDNGCFPGQVDAFQLWQAGWIPDNRVTFVGENELVTVTLQRIASPGPSGSLLALVEIPGSQNLLSIAARQRVGTDTPVPFDGVNIMEAVIRDGELTRFIDPPLIVVDEDNDDVLDDPESYFTAGETLDLSQAVGITITINSVAPDNSSYSVTIRNNFSDVPPDSPDLNQDGTVTARDVIYVINRVGTIDPVADVTNDGIVNNDDITLVGSQLGASFVANEPAANP